MKIIIKFIDYWKEGSQVHLTFQKNQKETATIIIQIHYLTSHLLSNPFH